VGLYNSNTTRILISLPIIFNTPLKLTMVQCWDKQKQKTLCWNCWIFDLPCLNMLACCCRTCWLPDADAECKMSCQVAENQTKFKQIFLSSAKVAVSRAKPNNKPNLNQDKLPKTKNLNYKLKILTKKLRSELIFQVNSWGDLTFPLRDADADKFPK